MPNGIIDNDSLVNFDRIKDISKKGSLALIQAAGS
jgi:hypothetical protein